MYFKKKTERSNDHISYSYERGTRYQQSLIPGRYFSLLRRSVYFFFTCLWSAAQKFAQRPQRFSPTVTKKDTASSVQSLLPRSPPSAASSTRNSHCPICDGMALPPAAGGNEIISTITLREEEYAQMILLERWNSCLWFSVIRDAVFLGRT